jgi:hypothetical protein
VGQQRFLNSNIMMLVTIVALLLAGLSLAVSLSMAVNLARAEQNGPTAPEAGAPTVVSYQGRVTVAGAAFDGQGFFKFALVNEAGNVSYWSNDGSSTGGDEPTNGTPLPVSGGLFTVLLGDTSLINMDEPLAAAVFDGSSRYLRVWFSDDNINFEQLSPDRRIASVPYALQAHNADTLDGQHADDLLPEGMLVLGRTPDETTLLDAGFSYTGRKLGDTWTTRAEMPTARYALVTVPVDGVIYAIGGVGSATAYETANEAYDPVTNAWTTRAPMPTGRYGPAAAAVDGVIYVIGGYSSSSVEAANEAYNPDTDTWTTKANMPTSRFHLAAAAVDGVIYALGGDGVNTNYETVNEAYDPAANSWAVKTPLPTGRSYMAAAVVDGVIYVIGGASETTPTETANEAYDPVTNAWATMAPMPTGREGLAAAEVDGLIYVLGGYSSFTPLTANEAYDPTTNTWAVRAAMPTGRFLLATAAVDGIIYAIGGSVSPTPLTANEAYTPSLYVYAR